MNDFIINNLRKEEVLSKAIRLLEIEDIEEFGKAIIELHNISTCNCFLKNHSDKFNTIFHLIEKLQFNEENYYHNIALGFILFINKNFDSSLQYLTKAINIDNSIDFPFSIRAKIESNSQKLEDAKEAVLLNPIPVNYFILAGILSKDKNEESLNLSLKYYDKAIELDPSFSCAHYNKGVRLRESERIKEAILEYEKCIQIEPAHWAYKSIGLSYFLLDNYEKTIEYSLKGIELNGEDKSYFMLLGYSYQFLNIYELAIQNFKRYLELNPDQPKIRTSLEKLEKKHFSNELELARKFYAENNYLNCIKIFNKLSLIDKISIEIEDIEIYFLALLNNNDENFNAEIENPVFKRLWSLKETSYEKLKNNLPLTEEEININKLLEYEPNYKVGFGIFQGEKISNIIKLDPYYILWCVINLEHFAINATLFLSQELQQEPEYLKALEINYFKLKTIDFWYEKVGDSTKSYYNENYDDDYDRHTFERYNGSYAQNEGWSDQDIDIVFEGDPDNYWNID